EELKPVGPLHERLGDVVAPAAATCTRAPTTRGAERIVTAPVEVGATVYAARYLGAWAEVVAAAGLQVRVRPKDDWVEIVTVPGVASLDECPAATALLDAWIPRAAVKLLPEPALPPDAGAR